jgi:hypothetical protein
MCHLYALPYNLELEVEKVTVRSSIRFWKTSDRALWRSQPPPKQKKRLPTAHTTVL